MSLRHTEAKQQFASHTFGRYGGGLLTGHPIGLVIVVGLLMMGLVGIPEARWFFGGSLVLGGIVGLLLWLRHRDS